MNVHFILGGSDDFNLSTIVLGRFTSAILSFFILAVSPLLSYRYAAGVSMNNKFLPFKNKSWRNY